MCLFDGVKQGIDWQNCNCLFIVLISCGKLTGIILVECYKSKKLFGYCASWFLEMIKFTKGTFATKYSVIFF